MAKHFGARVELIDACRVLAVIDPIQPFHRGGLQSSAVNGGVLASTFDLVLGMPGLLRAYPAQRTATVQLSMSFMKALKGERLVATGFINRASGGLLFTEAEIRDDQDQVCAVAQGVVRMIEAYSEPKRY